MSKIDGITWNLSDATQKHKLMGQIAKLPPGLYDVGIKRRARTRSLDQNAYWWSAVIGPWLEWLQENEGDPTITKEQAHLALKKAVLGSREIISKHTGEVVEIIPDSHTMTTEEFSQLIEAAAKWLAEFAEIVVIPSEAYFEAQESKSKLRKAS